MQPALKKQLLAPVRNPWFWLRVALLVAFLTLLNKVDPFGWYTAPEQSAELFIQKFTSPVHDYKKSQDKVSVVLIDENYYAPNKPLWPIPSREFKFKILKKILKRKPEAIFLDLTYPDTPREVTKGGKNTREEALIELAKSLQEAAKNTPILIGDALSGEPLKACSNQDKYNFACARENLHRQNILTKTFLDHAFSKPSKLQVVDVGQNFGDDLYPLTSDTIANFKGKNQKFSSPALALHKIYADNHAPNSELQKLWQSNDETQASNMQPWINGYQSVSLNENYATNAEDNKLSIQWGYYATQEMADLDEMLGSTYTQTCRFKPRPDNWAKRINDSINEYLSAIKNGIMDQQQALCPSVTHFSAALLGDVRQMTGSNEETSLDQTKLNKFLDNAIKDKIVMVGVNLKQAKDIAYSPLNDYIPGVFRHAAALQNLIEDDINYTREPNETEKILFDGLFIITMAYLFTILPMLVRHLHIRFVMMATILIPWLATLGLSYTSFPLSVALIGVLIGLIELIESQIEKIEYNKAIQQSIISTLTHTVQTTIQHWCDLKNLISAAVEYFAQKIAITYNKLNRLVKQKSRSKMSDFSNEMVELGGIEPPSANPPQTDLHT